MNFVRRGPRYLFFRSQQPHLLEKELIEKLDGQSLKFADALEESEEETSIAFITPVQKDKTMVEDASSIIYLPHSALVVMDNVINLGITDKINRIDLGPGQIVMRIPEQSGDVVGEIESNFKAGRVNILQGIDLGEAGDTVLSFTAAPIRNKIDSLSLVKENLLISLPVNQLLQQLRRDAVRYITHGLEQSQWYEQKINIYDTVDMYEEQYKRLVLALADLEMGFILGESWTKDHAIALLSVIAYQVRLFTLSSPAEIKRILMGLEYDDNGNRIVDYDLYHNSKKMQWFEIEEASRKDNRSDLGFKLRKSIFNQLSEETVKEIKELEAKIIARKQMNED